MASNSKEEPLLAETRWIQRRSRQSVIETRVTDPSGRLIVQATTTHVPL